MLMVLMISPEHVSKTNIWDCEKLFCDIVLIPSRIS